jgi:hypothetical protein
MHLEHRVRALEPAPLARSSLWDAAAARALQRRWRQLDLLHSSGNPIMQHQLEVAAGAAGEGAPRVDLPPQLQSCMHATFWDGDLALVARAITGAGGCRLWHGQLRAMWRTCVLVAVPFGARFKDVAQPLHGGQGWPTSLLTSKQASTSTDCV